MKRGFTLVEILIVIAVITILTAIALASFTTIEKQTSDSKRTADIAIIQAVLDKFYKENGEYPNGDAGTPVSDLAQQSKALIASSVSDPLDDKNDTFAVFRLTDGAYISPFCGQEAHYYTSTGGISCKGYGYYSSSQFGGTLENNGVYGSGCGISVSGTNTANSLNRTTWYILSWYSEQSNQIKFVKQAAQGMNVVLYTNVPSQKYPNQQCTFTAL